MSSPYPEAVRAILDGLNLAPSTFTKGDLAVRCPIDGAEIGRVASQARGAGKGVVRGAQRAFESWRTPPAPQRGALIRLLGEELRASKEPLGRLVSIEAGKILSEGLGEVQEMIDICDFAVGLSRQLHGLTIATERPEHRMMETWHPRGVTGIITAFNFPVAVWAWNSALALACGNSCVWKPSEKTPLTALATQALFERAAGRFEAGSGPVPQGLSGVIIGGRDVAEVLVDHPRVPLVSAT